MPSPAKKSVMAWRRAVSVVFTILLLPPAEYRPPIDPLLPLPAPGGGLPRHTPSPPGSPSKLPPPREALPGPGRGPSTRPDLSPWGKNWDFRSSIGRSTARPDPRVTPVLGHRHHLAIPGGDGVKHPGKAHPSTSQKAKASSRTKGGHQGLGLPAQAPGTGVHPPAPGPPAGPRR